MKTIRVAAHVHSEWSYDAEWPLAELVRAFRDRMYDAVLMAEHDRGFDDARWDAYRAACMEASTEELLLVPGMEYEDSASLVHVPVWGVDLPFLGAARPTEELLRDAKEHDAFTVFAHLVSPILIGPSTLAPAPMSTLFPMMGATGSSTRRSPTTTPLRMRQLSPKRA